MDKEQLVRHLRAWVDGVDPTTGTALPHDHPAQHADTLRLLHAALVHLAAAAPANSLKATAGGRAGARNAGRPWSAEDDVALAAGFDSGSNIDALALAFERTRGAIAARLVRLGKIEPPPGLRLRGRSDASSTVERETAAAR